MKHLILIGDSIRMGYQPFVQQLLEGKARVTGPEENCGTSAKTRDNLQTWVLDQQPDIVHINTGLHDLAREPRNVPNTTLSVDDIYQQPVRVPGPDYVENVRHNLLAILDAGIQVIWATTTPVISLAKMTPARLEADVENYNRMALAVAQNELKLPINNLFTFIMQQGKENMLKDDGVHFEEANSRKLAEQVVAAVTPFL